MSLRPSERAGIRRSGFKASVDAGEEGRRRRVDVTVDIRKTGRGSALQKRRRAAADAEAAPHAPQHPPPDLENKLGILPQLAQGLYSGDSTLQLEAIREFRKLLSIEKPPINQVISSGVVPCFVQLLAREDCPELQFEAAWVLTNIASGTPENTNVVLHHGAVPIFVKLLSSPREDIREQAVWALGNVAGDCASYHESSDIARAHGVLVPLLQLFNGQTELSMLRKATWALCNFCRYLPQASFEHVKPALPVLRQLIYSQDEEILNQACWALSYLTGGTEDNIQAVIESGVCPRRLVELLTHSSPSVIIPALHVIGNIAGGGDVLIQDVINGNIIGPLVHLMHTGEFGVRKSAAWAISHATSGGTHDQIKYLVSQGCIKAFCDLLSSADTDVLMVCLKGLENILKIGEAEKYSGACDVNMYAQMIDDAEGLDKIENLQTHENKTIFAMAAHLLESYWLKEDKTMPWLDGHLPPWLLEDTDTWVDFEFSDLPGDFDFG